MNKFKIDVIKACEIEMNVIMTSVATLAGLLRTLTLEDEKGEWKTQPTKIKRPKKRKTTRAQ